MVNLTFDHYYFGDHEVISSIYKVETDIENEQELIKAIAEQIKVPHSNEYYKDKRSGYPGTEYFFLFTSEGQRYMARDVIRRQR